MPLQTLLQQSIESSHDRLNLWIEFIRRTQVRRMVEIGVYQGDFAAAILERCDDIEKYFLLDPWRHLTAWKKPFNTDNANFERIFETAKAKTDFARDRRMILRGKTTEVIDQIFDGELDFAYIDGDHTLRGIAIDLMRVYPKIRPMGFIGGDDFSPSMWYHATNFEPSLVFPFAVYFAEAVGATIYALPHIQFCLQKTAEPVFRFVDLTGQYSELGIRDQLAPKNFFRRTLRERLPLVARIASKGKRILTRKS